MTQRKLPALTACLLALLAPAWVFALNLGDISLKSEPGQPLEAEIPLSDASADELGSLSVGLADVAGFRWAGIEWTPTLNQLQFELKRGADGADYIRIHSADALRTPLLRFLLKAAWTKGRLFREYTLELDASSDVSGDAPADTVTRTAEDDWQDVRAAVRESNRYKVVRSDTVWEIARQLRPDSSVTVQQMMLALLRTNPDAFSNDNINWLKAGAVLWMPSDFEMQALSAAEAFAQVLLQNNVWREAHGLPVVDTGWQPGTDAIAVDGGLRLVPVGEGDLEDDSVAVVAPEETAREQAREQALALANEQVEELSQENIELEDKLTESETIIEDLRRLVELKDDELAALQEQSMRADGTPDPGPGLPERLRSFHDATIKPLYNLARDHWQVVLAGLAVLLLLLAGWWFQRRKRADTVGGLTVPAASIRPDFAKVARPEKAASQASRAEDDAQQEDEEDAEDQEDQEDAEDGEDGEDGEDEEDAEDEEDGEDEEDAEDEEEEEDEEDEEDEAQNKLDLARAYLELDDRGHARTLLGEVLSEGNAAQRQEARQLMERANSGK